MPIEVSTKFSHKNIFVAGEKLVCDISFHNTDSQNRSDLIAWSSAQFLCQCTLSQRRQKLRQKRVVLPPPVNTTASHVDEQDMAQDYMASPVTAFVPSQGEEGQTVLSNKPKILFCNLSLLPNEVKTCRYEASIPFEAPPSYRGHSIKYTYKLVIGVQKFNSAAQLLRLPFRVLSMCALTEATVYQLSHATGAPPSNPFCLRDQSENGIHSDESDSDRRLQRGDGWPLKSAHNPKSPDDAPKDSVFEAYLQLLAAVTGRKQLCKYNLSNAQGAVVRLTMAKNAYKLGEDITGVLDFSMCQVPCLAVTITLQSEEIDLEPGDINKNGPGRVTKHQEQQMDTLSMRMCHLSLNIPSTCTPCFQTDLVLLQWRLHFEFFIATSQQTARLLPLNESSQPQPRKEVLSWHPPITVNSDILSWDFPLMIYPNNLAVFTHQEDSLSVKIVC